MTPVWLDYYYWASIRPNRYFSGKCPHCGKWTNAKNEKGHYGHCPKKTISNVRLKEPLKSIKNQNARLTEKKDEDHSKDLIYVFGLIIVVCFLILIASLR